MKVKCTVVALIMVFVSCENSTNTIRVKPKLGNIVESVYSSAVVVPDEAYFVRSTRLGIISQIFVKEGDVVGKGQRLFSIKPTADVGNRIQNANINVQDAYENLMGNNNILANLNLELEMTKDKLALDSVNYMRKKRLWEKNIGSRLDFERAELTYQSAVNKLKGLERKYLQTKRDLASKLEKAQNQLDTEKKQLNDYEIRSEINGKIFGIFKEEGEYIAPSENFAEIGTSERYLIELDIDEIDITKVNIGDTAIVSLEAYPNEVFHSVVENISDKKDGKSFTFKAECSFINTPKQLFNGLSGEANVIVGRRKNALIIPSEYLIKGNKVLTEEGEISVQVGVKNLSFVELTEGMDSSEYIIKPN